MPHSLPDLEAWAIFAKVAECGSFSRAGEQLGLAKTTVSKAVTRLEHRMRASLFHRTTRKLSLTETGRLALERAARILIDGAAIEADILDEAAIPRGLVRIATISALGVEVIAPVLPEFLKANPEIEVDLVLTENRVDLVAEGFDAAIQVGLDGDSASLRAVRLSSLRPNCSSGWGRPKRRMIWPAIPPSCPATSPTATNGNSPAATRIL